MDVRFELATLLLLVAQAQAQKVRVPLFADYAVSEVYGGRSLVQRDQLPFKGSILLHVVVNFAGHFSVLEWGDNDKLSMLVIDAVTGDVFKPPFAGEHTSFDLPHGLSLANRPQYRVRSRLMIFRGVCTNDGQGCGTYFFSWGQNRWTQVDWEPSPARPSDQSPQRIRFASLISKIDPVYPMVDRRESIEGAVWLDATIGKDGHVRSARPISGSTVLFDAAKGAVMQWVYRPTLLNNEPIDVVLRVCVPFAMRESKHALGPCSSPTGHIEY
jgi:hypothetical protein